MTQDLQHKIENIINRNPQADDREIVLQLKQLLYETELQSYAGKEVKNIAGLVAENIHQLNSETYQTAVIKSGFDDFDVQFGGFRPGEFVVVGGRPAMGKTQFLVNLSLSISATIPVLYATLDLSEFLLTNRFISSVSDIPASCILQRNLNEEQKDRLAVIGNEFAKRQLFIHDCSNTSIAALKANCQKLIQENGVQVIVVDYLQLVSSYKHKNYRELEISYICRELKNMAKEYNVCVIASSQLSRATESRYGGEKRPQLSDLRDSGAIEQDADKVLFIYRPEYYGILADCEGNSTAYMAEIIVAKNRNGRLGEFKLLRDNDFTNFRKYKNEFTFSSDRLLELEKLRENPF
ncbi:MAG: DnaB-like helicase C-terminal domain-containing protein [Candidatus Azobacteroides sp.]|nr:DnaB-like helicase C-terminal domain-containing protein [Candidatus Azobacteroides sp.]